MTRGSSCDRDVIVELVKGSDWGERAGQTRENYS